MTKKQKHLTLEDRIDIQTGISQQETFRSIAEKIGKDPSTISKEIKRNRIMHPTSVKADCTDYPLLKKAPYVCNNCPKKRTDCGFNRYLYSRLVYKIRVIIKLWHIVLILNNEH